MSWTPDRFRLDGASALVVGASRGIGKASALALAAAGADLTLASRDHDGLEATARAVRALGNGATVVPCDVTSDHDIEALFEGLPDLDVLVYCSGVNAPGKMIETPAESLDRMLAINLRGAFRMAQAAARNMLRAARPGRIIFVSSQMGHVGAPERTVYCATKHGLEGLTKAMAVELAPDGIRVTTIAPTFVDTPLTAPFFEDEEFRQSVIDRIPLGRIATVDDVAGAIVFAASPASSFVTGSSVLVDGGWTAQ